MQFGKKQSSVGFAAAFRRFFQLHRRLGEIIESDRTGGTLEPMSEVRELSEISCLKSALERLELLVQTSRKLPYRRSQTRIVRKT